MYYCGKLLDPVVLCPYNKSHLITRSRLQKHIVKCEKNFPENYKVMCPFNATHRLFKYELEDHIVSCPARKISESDMDSDSGRYAALTMQSEISSTIDCTENWDLEAEEDNSRSFTDQESVSELSITTQMESFDLQKDTNEKVNLRAPRGYSEAMLREETEGSCTDDLESVISSMGIGRGKINQHKNQLKMIGMGRGKILNTY